MISKTDLASLSEYEGKTGGVLSIYLDTDQSNAANLNRGFELALNDALRTVAGSLSDETQLREFEASAARVRDFASKYVPEAKGLVVYSQSSGSLWARELQVPLKTEVHWGESAQIQPLLAALEQYKRYGFILVDRVTARVYTTLLGEIEKYSEINSTGLVQHLKSPGSDHLCSQAGIQRKADGNIHSHLKHSVDLLEDFAQAAPFERLVLAGSIEATSELYRLLPKALRARVVESVVLPITATEQDILAAIGQVEQRVERGFELARVEKLFDASGGKHKATTGVSETLTAINEKRVRELMYADGQTIPGGICRECGAVFASKDSKCSYCSGTLDQVDDIVELAATRALAGGAGIEQFRGEAAKRLSAAGGLGAFLRY